MARCAHARRTPCDTQPNQELGFALGSGAVLALAIGANIAISQWSTRSCFSRSTFYADLLDRLRAVPGVSAAAGVAYLPMGREPRSARDYFIQGRPEGQAGERPQAELHAITPDYFKTLEIPVCAGHEFDRTDTPEGPPVTIIMDENSLANTLRALLHDANPTVPVRFETMEELFDFALAYPRFRTIPLHIS